MCGPLDLTTPPRVPVLIASWLEPDLVARIADSEPDRIEVLYAPELLPRPRYVADHHGRPRDLTDGDRQRWRSLLARAEVSFEFDWERPTELLKRAPALRWVQATSSGIGPLIHRLGLDQGQILITNAAGIHAQPLAEFVLMAALYFTKDISTLRQWQQDRHWERYGGHELAGGRMLVVGLGEVGRRIAKLSAAIGLDVTGCRRSVSSTTPEGVRRVVSPDRLEEVLGDVDFLVLAAPDTKATFHLIDGRRLGMLKRDAVIVNVGRGSLIDEAALIECLRRGKLRGAALDVFEQEPLPESSPLWSMPNVIVSPHSASTVVQENDRLVSLFTENLHRYLDGQSLINLFVRDEGRHPDAPRWSAG